MATTKRVSDHSDLALTVTENIKF